MDLNKFNYLVKNSGLQQQHLDDDGNDFEDAADKYEDDKDYKTMPGQQHQQQAYFPNAAAIQHQQDLLAAFQNKLSNFILAQQQQQ